VETISRPIIWLGNTLEVVREFPATVRQEIGYALYLGQTGGKHISAKPLHGFGCAVMEIALASDRGAFRVVYTVNVGSRLYVLHAFQKKSRRGISTPQHDVEVIRQRLKRALEIESEGT
jgi:phage-related protein